MIKRAGEQFMLDIKFSVTTFSQCAQMVASLYNANTGVVAARFVKTPDPQYADAELIRSTNDDHVVSLFFTEAITRELLGRFQLEFKLVYTGAEAPITKPASGVITFKESYT